AVTDGHRGHAMPATDRAIRIPVQLRIIVSVQINKPRRNHETGGVQHFGCIAGIQAPNLGDLAVLYANVRLVPCHPRAIDHCPAFNNSVELRHKTLLWLTKTWGVKRKRTTTVNPEARKQ